MTIIVVPTEQCNFKCTYCFEPEDQRRGFDLLYNFERIKASLKDVWSGPYNGSAVCLHGGEPLLANKTELERLMKLIYNLPWKCEDGSIKPKGAVSIVTNGSMIDDEIIALFKRYNVYVGLSCDGPPDLNVLRGPDPNDSRKTEEYNLKLVETMRKLRENGIPVSIMCILHRENASTIDKVKTLGAWMLWLKKMGINGGRMNPMYSDKYSKLELTNDELYRAWSYFYRMNKEYDLRWNPVMEMEKNLQEEKNSPCHFVGCDKFATCTLSIQPNGTIGNCDRTFSDGLYLRSMDKSKSGRYEALAQTQCRACRYWQVCYGTCPEEGVGGDWRNKTRFCDAVYKMYAYIERALREENPGIELVVDSAPEAAITPHGNKAHGDESHGDEGHGDDAHGDAPHGDEGHGDAPHGDIPHGDSHHGDSPDWRRP